MKIVRTDVVVVGGGAAGCYAALTLTKLGIKALVVCKGLVGKSGASIFAGNLVLAGRLLGNTEEQASNTAEFLIKYHNQFLIDQNWAKRCGNWIASTYYAELEEAGLYFRRDHASNVVTNPGKIRSVAANRQGTSGVPFMDLRRKQLIRNDVPFLEETVVTSLLHQPDGSIGGIFGIEFPTGEYVAVLARAVILATGYSDRLHMRSTGTREMSADGLAMSWRAGASMMNLEMQWWHTNDVAHPNCWQRVQIYPNPMLGSHKSARMVNSAGEEFFNQQEDDPLAYGPYTVQLKALVREVRAGRARYEGGYYCGFDHCSEEEVDTYTSYSKPFHQLGLSVEDDLLETAVTAHYRQGGVLVDVETMQSSIPGLYIAGGLAGHSNGLIGLATYDGKIAAEGVAGKIDRLPECPLPEAEIEEERNRLERLRTCNGSSGPSPAEVKRSVQRILWDGVGVEKDEASMTHALDELRRVRLTMIPHLTLKYREAAVNYEWLDAIDLMNMMDAAELVVHSSLERKESRGPFIRRDYPNTDNQNWLAANVLEKTENGFRSRRIKYDLPFFAPGFALKDNLEVPW